MIPSLRFLGVANLVAVAALLRPAAAADSPPPWGELRVSTYALTMPGALAEKIEFADTGTWSFALRSWAPLDQLLATSDLSTAERAALQSPFARSISTDGLTRTLRVPDEVRWSLTPTARAQLYQFVGAFPVNRIHMLPFVLPEPEVIARAHLNPRLRAGLARLTFNRGPRSCLVDADLLATLADDAAERGRLNQLLYRTPALTVEVLRPAPADRAAFATYWSDRTPRRVNEVLRRFAQSAELDAVDVLQLLPKLPRQVLNSFPDDRISPLAANCLWTSLHFFDDTPSSRFLPQVDQPDTTEFDARAELDARYHPVKPPYQFGDIIGLWADNGRQSALVHLVVHVADNIVMTKNGVGDATPFVLSTLPEVTRRYAWIYDLEIRAYRRNE